MKKGKNYWLLVLLTYAMMSCVSPKALEYRTIQNLSVEKLGFNQTTLNMNLEYYNPNSFGLKLRSSDLDIYIGEQLLGHSRTDTLVTIPGKKTFLLPIAFHVDMQNLLRNTFHALSGKEVVVRLKGKVQAGKGGVFFTIPVNYETKHKFTLF